MKKYFSLLLIFLTINFVALSQKTKSKFELEFSFGPSFPLGKFADKSVYSPIATDPSGWAKTGLAAQISLSYKLNKSFSIDLKGGWQQNDRDNESFQESIKQDLGPDAQIISIAKTWTSWKVQAGPEFHLPIDLKGDNIFQFGIAAGILKTHIPGAAYEAYLPASNGYVLGSQSDQPRPWNFCYQVNAGLQHRVKSNVLIKATLNWDQASLSQHYPDFYMPSGSVRPAFTQTYQLGSLNFLAGIVFEL